MRGIAKVNSQILQRSNHASSDLQRFSKKIGKDFDKLALSLEEAQGFLTTAKETFSVPQGLGEFVTFKTPEFDYEEEQQALQNSLKE